MMPALFLDDLVLTLNGDWQDQPEDGATGLPYPHPSHPSQPSWQEPQETGLPKSHGCTDFCGKAKIKQSRSIKHILTLYHAFTMHLPCIYHAFTMHFLFGIVYYCFTALRLQCHVFLCFSLSLPRDTDPDGETGAEACFCWWIHQKQENWLVVWNIWIIFPNSWDDDPIWLITVIFFRG